MESQESIPLKQEKDRPVLLAVFFVFAYILSYSLSGTLYPNAELDTSWSAVLEHAARLKFQFGRDIVFTYGPLAYLYNSFSQGYLIGSRVFFSLFLALVIAVVATSIVRQTTGWIRVLFIVWFLIFYRTVFWTDTTALLVIAYGSLFLMSDINERKVLSVLFIVALALFSLIKFNFFLSVAVGIVLSSLAQFAGKRLHTAWFIPTVFTAIFLSFWLVLGQDLSSLWPWIKGSLAIAGGYTEAMSFPGNPWMLRLCVTAVILFLVALIMNIRQSKITLNKTASLTWILMITFLSWKQGVVRADIGHVLTFIPFLPFAYILAFTDGNKAILSVVARNTISILYGGVILLTVIAGNIQQGGSAQAAITSLPKRLLDNSRLLVKSMSGDWQGCYAAVRHRAEQPRDPDLPIARSVIGESSVDVIGYRQWAALANNLNYHPRPVFQGYIVYSPYLQDLNLAFFRSERRPQSLLFNAESIDFRYPMLDDATILPFIFKNYTPVARDGMFLILRQNDGLVSDVNMRLVHEQSLAFDEILDLEAWNKGPLIIQAIAQPSVLGRVYAFLYQAPVLGMKIFTGNQMTYSRFIPAMAERGFLVNPVLLNNDDVTNFYKKTGVAVWGISLSREGTSDLLTSNKITVKVFQCDLFSP